MERSNDASAVGAGRCAGPVQDARPSAAAGPGLPARVRAHLRSRATIRSMVLALGAFVLGAWQGLPAGAVAVAGAFAIAYAAPHVVTLGNRREDRVAFVTALVSAVRLARLLIQLAIGAVVAALGTPVLGPVQGLAPGSLADPAALVALFGLGSAGWHYLGSDLAYRGVGNRSLNALAAIVPGAVLLLLRSGDPAAPDWAFPAYCYGGMVPLCALLAVSLASDMRSRWHPRRGVGVFFGTFNPFHRTHLAIVERALRDRGLERIVIHPTVIPKIHAQALRRGEIAIDRREQGMRVYEKTERADPNVDYFPTGNRFFEHSARRAMIELALREAGLDGRVEVWSCTELYAQRGFHGILREIRRRHPGVPLHGIHGSDPGGMWVRSIFDQSGWLYPCPVRRIDGVSATAVRAGAKGMVPPVVDRVLDALRAGEREFVHEGRRFVLTDGEMREAE